MNLLETESKTKDLFDKFLREVVSDVSTHLRMGGRNPKKLLKLFSDYRVTLDPQTFWHYDTDGNAFVINLLDLLYTPSWRLAPILVHEAEHVLFLKSKGMLYAPEPRQEEFAEKFKREGEIRALKAEWRFLLAIKRYVPPETRTYATTRMYRIDKIDDIINDAVNWLSELKENKDTQAKKYYEGAEKIALNNHAQICSMLGIELPKPNSDGKYKQLRIDLKLRT